MDKEAGIPDWQKFYFQGIFKACEWFRDNKGVTDALETDFAGHAMMELGTFD